MANVAEHYDSLDAVYRAVWGEALHHGVWVTGEESLDKALDEHRERVMKAVEEFDEPGRVVDVGCGYGVLCEAMRKRWDCEVVGVTNSRKQFSCGREGVVFGDWRMVDVGMEFDAVTMVEVMGHVDDLKEWFRVTARRMRVGGVLVIMDFHTGAQPNETRMRKLMFDGRFVAMRTVDEIITAAEAAGLEFCRREDWTKEVKKTWSVMAARMLSRSWRSMDVWRSALKLRSVNDLRLAAIPRMIRAYAEGDLAYSMLVFRRRTGVDWGDEGRDLSG